MLNGPERIAPHISSENLKISRLQKKKAVQHGGIPNRARASASKATKSAARSPSLSEQAYEAIKGRILSLEYPPGQILNEAVICEALGIGRTPVHQAVHRLNAEGLIEIIPHKGLIVRTDSLKEIVCVLEARQVIEPYIAGLAAERITQENAERLRNLVKESSKLVDQKFRHQYTDIDREFHKLIGNIADNPVMAEFMRNLHERSIRIWHLRWWQEHDLQDTQTEHSAVVQAIARRDRPAAEKAMRTHIESLRARILRSMR